MALYWWRLLNIAIFYSKLHPPKDIICKKFHVEYGHCIHVGQSDKVVLGIRTEQIDKRMFLLVLVHEMVHQYEWQINKKMSHGKTFYEWAPRIKRILGLSLTEFIEEE